MSSICDDPTAARELKDTLDTARLYLNLTGYIIRLAMGLAVTLYLYFTREVRQFPIFVKLQLLLIDVEYFLTLAVCVWQIFVTDQGDEDPPELFVKVTYPVNNLTSLMFLYYNWLYVF